MLPKIIQLHTKNKVTINQVGGKGFNLIKLTQAKLNVPNGFILTTKIFDIISKNKKIPPPLKTNILTNYHNLSQLKVAVRSSATIEDSALTSFAGQFGTFLNIEGDKELLQAILKCYKDLKRVKSYIKNKKIKCHKIAMAIVIQIMVPAEKAGVIFTVNPITSNSSKMLINASKGLGENVVSGIITPEEITISKSKNPKIEIQVQKNILQTNEIKNLLKTALKIEKYYKKPQDIEWAIANNKLYILQSRAITTLIKPATKSQSNELKAEIKRLKKKVKKNTIWSSFNISEILPEGTPFSLDLMQKIMSPQGGLGKAYTDFFFPICKKVKGENYIEQICGRTYINIERENKLFFANTPFAYNFEMIKKNPAQGLYPEISINYRHKSILNILVSPFNLLRYLFGQFYASNRRKKIIKKITNIELPQINIFVKNYQKKINQKTSIAQLKKYLKLIIDKYTINSASLTLKSSIISHISWKALTNLCLRAGINKKSQNILFTTTKTNKTLELHQAFFDLKNKKINTKTFLDHFGHRSLQDLECQTTRFSDFKEKITQIIKDLSPTTSPKTVEKERAKIKKRYLKKIEKKLGYQPLLFYRLNQEVIQLEKCLQLRENIKHYILKELALIRKIILILDKKLKIGDLFYLKTNEICSNTKNINLSKLIHNRKNNNKKLLKIPLPNVILAEKLDKLGEKIPLDNSKTRSGQTVYAGDVTGKVKIIANKKKLPKINKNTILVLPDADPVWTVLFPKAKGLVIEKGGVLSHSAIVAREYGIPAIINVPNITKTTKNNQKVRLDAKNGQIHFL